MSLRFASGEVIEGRALPAVTVADAARNLEVLAAIHAALRAEGGAGVAVPRADHALASLSSA